ncbi:hypothetical protein [Thiocystis violacea]|uniref:hypothetical protein n=1 Tax=Thiocystis violacea TaxID=13725 RepID=UPI001905053C|nr:hypothetical protein [Thiocystis violacea]
MEPFASLRWHPPLGSRHSPPGMCVSRFWKGRMNIHRNLYGFHGSCLGYENAERRRQAVLAWLGRPVPNLTLGTAEHFKAYQAAMRLGHEHHQRTGERCWSELTPALIGLEQTRVAILNPQGQEIRRFWVGRSTGWMPCHLSISRRSAHGGYPVDLAPGERVRMVRRA